MHLPIPINIIVHEVLHGLFALPFAWLLWQKTHSKKLIVILFVTAYFLDLDHLVDYFRYHGFSFNLILFLRNDYFVPGTISFVPLHGWEWFAIFCFLAYKSKKKWKSLYAAIALGLLSHLLLDAMNVGSFLFYSVIYRVLHIVFI